MNVIEEIHKLCCSDPFPLPTAEQVQALQNRWDISFPENYRAYLVRYNGGFFDGPIIRLPEPITVQWRDGLVTHHELALDTLYGLCATHRSAELGSESSVNTFDDNDPVQLLPIGYTASGCMLLMDFYPGLEGNILVKFPSEKAYKIAEDFDQFLSLLVIPRDDTGKIISTR